MSAAVLEALALGGLAGLTVAVPPGAITALLLELARRHGRRPAGAAALGVATVDGGYALLAVVAGSAAIALLEPVAGTLTLVAAAVLACFALAGLASLRDAPAVRPARPVPAGRPYATFVLLTAVNPSTLALFAAIAAGSRDVLEAGAPARAAFAVGAFAASLAWQMTLATAGAMLGRLPARAHLWASGACHLAVLAVAAKLAVDA